MIEKEQVEGVENASEAEEKAAACEGTCEEAKAEAEGETSEQAAEVADGDQVAVTEPAAE